MSDVLAMPRDIAKLFHGLEARQARAPDVFGERVPSQLLEDELIIRLPKTNLVIAGVERTQAIQYFDFNGQGSGFAANNSVAAVANKTMVLRTYVNRLNFSWLPKPAAVTGVVKARRLTGLFPVAWQNLPDPTAINAPAPAMPSGAIDRGNPDHTLNFRLPPSSCQGLVQLTVTVFAPGHEGETAYSSEPVTFWVNFEQVPRVRVHGVLIHYTGRGLDIAAPSGIDLINTLEWVARVYPISGIQYTACEVIEFSGDLTVGDGGGCSTGWNQLFNILWNMRAASGTDDVFVGLLPPGVPTNGVIGCGGGGVAIAYVGAGPVMAQEIGHAFGRRHAPCGNPGNVDPNYPNYGSYPSGSIGEFGYDTKTNVVWNPSSTFDYMSYCGPTSTSPYTFVGLKNALTASAASASAESPHFLRQEREHLLLNFRVQRDGKVQLRPSYHLPLMTPAEETGPSARTACELVDERGEVVMFHRCHLNDAHGDEHGPETEYREVVPFDAHAREIRFLRDDEVCETIAIEMAPPKVEITEVKAVRRQGELIRIRWKAQGDVVGFLVRFSHDGGRTWRAVAADLTKTEHVVNGDLLPGGPACRFQVLASSGIRTGIAESEPFELARKPRQAVILTPTADAEFTEGRDVFLQGGGHSPDFGTTEDDECVWTLDGAPLGAGYEVIATGLAPGRHEARLEVPDGCSGQATASVRFRVKCKG